MFDDVKSWLEKLGLGKYAELFYQNEISFRALPLLSEDDLKALGLPLGARRSLQAAIEQLPKDVAKPMTAAQKESTSTLGDAERRQLTVMFCDLADSTKLSQKLDPEDMREINRMYQDRCKAAIERYEGYVARYMGDGVLAYFGYPQAHEDDAERAIHAGLGVVDSMADLNATLGDSHGVTFGVRIGIATGPVVVGDLIGEGASQEHAVVGETPNLAARLQAMASINSVVIGPKTHDLAGGRFEYQDLGTSELKGIAEPVQAWRAIAASAAESRFKARYRTRVTPLVGREHELGLLLERWKHAQEGDGQVVLLSGEPGIGKSRISEALHERTLVDEPITIRYQCSPYHTHSALHPVIAQLERAARFDRGDSPAVRLDKLESLLLQATQALDAAPLIGSLLSIPIERRHSSLDMTPEQQKDETFEALVSQLEGLARQKQVLIIFEDVHWADPTSLELLDRLIERTQYLPVLAVITFRPEFSTPWAGHSHITALTLNRFSQSLAVTMIDKVTGGKQLPYEVRDQIIEKTDGVPLFVEEFTKTVIESELLEDKGDRYALTGPLLNLAIPSTLHDSLMARLDRLAPVREVAQIAAVIGREFSHEVLAKVSPLTEEELANALAQLTDAALIFRRGATPKTHYVFKHALVQDAAYESLLKSTRRKIHRRIAEALEKVPAEGAEIEPELLAFHYTEAGLIPSALNYWLRAGKRSAEHGAYVEAVAHLTRGLSLLETLPEGEKRNREEIVFRLALGVPLASVEGIESTEVEKNYSRAQVLCEDTGDIEQLFPVMWGLWFYHMHKDLRRACRISDQLHDIALQRNDDVLRLEAHHCQWASRFLVGDLSAALDHCTQGINLYRADDHHALTYTFGGHDPGVCAYSFSALALWLSGYPEQAQKLSASSRDLARELSHPGTSANELTLATALSAFQRNAPALMRQADELLAFVPVEPMLTYQFVADAARGWAMFAQGKREGLLLMRQSVESGLGRDRWHVELISLVAETLGLHVSVKEGLEIVEQTLSFYLQNNVHWWEAELYRVRGELLQERGDINAAEDCFKRGVKVAHQQGAKSLELRAAISLAQLWRDQGKREVAHELLDSIYGCFTEGFDTHDVNKAKFLLEQLL